MSKQISSLFLAVTRAVFVFRMEDISTDHILHFQCVDTHRASHLMFLGLWRHLLWDEFDWSLDLPPGPLGAVR